MESNFGQVPHKRWPNYVALKIDESKENDVTLVTRGVGALYPLLCTHFQDPMSDPRIVKVVEIWDFTGEPVPEVKRDNFRKATLVPRDYYLGELPSGAPATRAASAALSDPNVYLKRIEPFTFDPNRPDSHPPALDLLHELQVCEELSRSLHPNVCRYLGYVPTPDGKHLLGLCFQRHQVDLSDAVKDKVVFDPIAVIEGIRHGLEYLHSLGYAHNDINPTNIVLDKNTLPVIIDFDSCQRIGVSLTDKKAGKMDWEYNSDVSLPQNDFDALGMVEKWLEENYTTAV
ncbi:kinase-like domain-containing protein [Mycena haematopus]|nr:kinase-like domain-containing protein [Mycena haematopus]